MWRALGVSLSARGRKAYAFAARDDCGDKLVELAAPGDRIVIMGARDDSLAVFAAELVERLNGSLGR